MNPPHGWPSGWPGSLPGDLDRVFFCDSGSVSVEVALKLAVQYWQARECPEKCCFLALRGGYHGDTFAAMSVSDPDNSLHDRFRNLLPRQYFTPQPPDARLHRIRTGRRLCAVRGRSCCPPVRTCRSRVGARASRGRGVPPLPARIPGAGRCTLCARHEVLLIADEIATGFGRTGALVRL